jgi:hypothetical protein
MAILPKLYDQPEKIILDLYHNAKKLTPEEAKRVKTADVESFLIKKLETAREKAKAILRAKISNPLRYYCPSGIQEEYIKTVGTSHLSECNGSDTPVVGYFAANGTGKTETTLHIILNIISGIQNEYFNYPMFRSFPYPKLCWYVSTSSGIKDVVVPELMRLLKGRTGYEFKKDGKPTYSRVVFDNGWQIIFKTFDQNIEQFESASCGIIAIDEPAQEYIWKACKSRRRMGCLMLLPLTPLYAPPYLRDEVTSMISANQPGYFMITADVYSACKKRGVRGYLKPNVIDDMVSSYSEDEKLARAYGKFMFFFGKVYSGFTDRLHVVDPLDYPLKRDYIYKHIVDPHDSRDNAEVWVAITPEGRYIFFDETPDEIGNFWEMKNPVTIPSDVKRVKQKEEKIEIEHGVGLKHIKRIMDRHFGNQKSKGRVGDKTTTLIEDYKKAGLNFIESYKAPSSEKEIHYGHNKVREALKILPDGKPGIVIWHNCKHLISGINHYIYKRNVSDGDDRSGEVVDKFKDFADVLRYAVCDTSKTINYEEVEKRDEEIKQYVQKRQYDNYYNKPLIEHLF